MRNRTSWSGGASWDTLLVTPAVTPAEPPPEEQRDSSSIFLGMCCGLQGLRLRSTRFPFCRNVGQAICWFDTTVWLFFQSSLLVLCAAHLDLKIKHKHITLTNSVKLQKTFIERVIFLILLNKYFQYCFSSSNHTDKLKVITNDLVIPKE